MMNQIGGKHQYVMSASYKACNYMTLLGCMRRYGYHSNT